MECQTVRALDDYEKFFLLPDGPDAFNECMAIGLDGYLSLDEIRYALNMLQQRHDFLNVHVHDRSDPWFVRFSDRPIPLDLENTSDSNGWVDTLLSELHDPVAPTFGPMVRVKWIVDPGGGTLLVTAHHLCLDGLSLFSICQELFAILRDKRGDNLKPSPCHPLPPPLKSGLLPDSKSSIQSPAVFCAPASVVCHDGQPIGLKTGICTRSLSKSMTEVVRQAAKAQNVRVNGCLCAAAISSLGKIMADRTDSDPKDILCQIAVNLRPYLDSRYSVGNLGCFVSTLYFDQSWSSDIDFWDQARDIDSDLHSQLEQSDLPAVTYREVQRLLENYPDFVLLKAARNPTRPYVGVSNLGLQELSIPKELQLRFVYPTVSLQGTFYDRDNVYVVAITVDGQLHISIMYPEPLMPRQIAETFADQLVASMGSLGALSLEECIA